MSPWAKKGAPEPLRLSDSEHTMTKTAALRRRDWDADSSGQPGSAPAACCQTRTAPSRRGCRSICKPASPRPIFTHIIILSASGILLSRWLEGTTRQASRLNFLSSGERLPDRAQVSVCCDRPGLLFPSSPFLAVLDSAFGGNEWLIWYLEAFWQLERMASIQSEAHTAVAREPGQMVHRDLRLLREE